MNVLIIWTQMILIRTLKLSGIILMLMFLTACQRPIEKPDEIKAPNGNESFALRALQKNDCVNALYWKNKIIDEIGSSGQMNSSHKYVINLVEDLCGVLEERVATYDCGRQKNKKAHETCLGNLLGLDALKGRPATGQARIDWNNRAYGRAIIARDHLNEGDCRLALKDVERLETIYADVSDEYKITINEIKDLCGKFMDEHIEFMMWLKETK